MRGPDGGWECGRDGVVPPLWPYEKPSVHGLLEQATETDPPTWLPWPLPAHWSLSGVGRVGDETVEATVLSCSGPDVVGVHADLVIVCEEPGVGLGARYAGAGTLDVGTQIAGSPPTHSISVGSHATPLWWVTGGADRDVHVGEASGRWLWLVAWPATAGAFVATDLELVALDELLGQLEMIPLSALCPRL